MIARWLGIDATRAGLADHAGSRLGAPGPGPRSRRPAVVAPTTALGRGRAHLRVAHRPPGGRPQRAPADRRSRRGRARPGGRAGAGGAGRRGGRPLDRARSGHARSARRAARPAGRARPRAGGRSTDRARAPGHPGRRRSRRCGPRRAGPGRDRGAEPVGPDRRGPVGRSRGDLAGLRDVRGQRRAGAGPPRCGRRPRHAGHLPGRGPGGGRRLEGDHPLPPRAGTGTGAVPRARSGPAVLPAARPGPPQPAARGARSRPA